MCCMKPMARVTLEFGLYYSLVVSYPLTFPQILKTVFIQLWEKLLVR